MRRPKHNTLKTMNLYHIKLTDTQKDALECLFNMGIVWNKTELSEAWEQLREQVREASCTVAIINAIQNSECNCKKPTAPKYDPCRLFRKGDKVHVVEWNGRNYYDLDHCTKLETGCLAEIWEDEEAEQQEGYVSVIYQGYIRSVPPCYLKLITPVEEQPPYSVSEATVQYLVKKDNKKVVAQFCKLYHPTPKASAEDECARLNAEYRKEVEK